MGDIGRDSLKIMIIANHAVMKDTKMEVIKQVADEEYVFSRMRISGTSDGSLPGMAKGPYNMTAVEVIRFENGKAIEHWEYMDPLDVMKMMGAGQPPAKDSTAK
jgi:predicted ester cyclase